MPNGFRPVPLQIPPNLFGPTRQEQMQMEQMRRQEEQREFGRALSLDQARRAEESGAREEERMRRGAEATETAKQDRDFAHLHELIQRDPTVNIEPYLQTVGKALPGPRRDLLRELHKGYKKTATEKKKAAQLEQQRTAEGKRVEALAPLGAGMLGGYATAGQESTFEQGAASLQLPESKALLDAEMSRLQMERQEGLLEQRESERRAAYTPYMKELEAWSSGQFASDPEAQALFRGKIEKMSLPNRVGLLQEIFDKKRRGEILLPFEEMFLQTEITGQTGIRIETRPDGSSTVIVGAPHGGTQKVTLVAKYHEKMGVMRMIDKVRHSIREHPKRAGFTLAIKKKVDQGLGLIYAIDSTLGTDFGGTFKHIQRQGRYAWQAGLLTEADEKRFPGLHEALFFDEKIPQNEFYSKMLAYAVIRDETGRIRAQAAVAHFLKELDLSDVRGPEYALAKLDALWDVYNESRKSILAQGKVVGIDFAMEDYSETPGYQFDYREGDTVYLERGNEYVLAKPDKSAPGGLSPVILTEEPQVPETEPAAPEMEKEPVRSVPTGPLLMGPPTPQAQVTIKRSKRGKWGIREVETGFTRTWFDTEAQAQEWARVQNYDVVPSGLKIQIKVKGKWPDRSWDLVDMATGDILHSTNSLKKAEGYAKRAGWRIESRRAPR